MKYLNVIGMIWLALSPIAHMRDAVAQVPPHRPGSVCVTPKFWCWANPPGRVGAQCGCPTPYGKVPGTLN
jgi:hypothetical protein